MMKDFELKIVNVSNVFGGQERYAESIARALVKRHYAATFEGGGVDESQFITSESSFEPDVMILNGNAALYKYSLRSIEKAFTIYVQHSDINDGQGPKWKRLVRKLLLKVLLKRVDLVVRVCNKALPEKYAKGKIVTIYNGVALPSDNIAPRANFSMKLLMIGALTENKNQRMAIEALTLLPNASLTVVGDGPERQALELFAKELKVTSRVTFTGFVSDPSCYYQSHDLLLMLSNYEAFPYVVLEAMAAYCPVVSVKVGGVPEAIDSGSNGWLLDSYSYKELANKINVIGQDLPAYERIAKRARLTIEERFTEEHMVDQLLDEIEKRYKKL